MTATLDRPNPLDRPDTSTQTAQNDRSTPGGDGIDRYCVGGLTQPKLMTTTITLNKTFEIDLEDNTTINVMVCLEASTADADDDEDFQANQRIRSFTYDNVLEPLQEALTELFTAEDLADLIGPDTKPKDEPSEMLTSDDYPESDPEDSIGMGYGGSDFDPGEHPIHDDNG